MWASFVMRLLTVVALGLLAGSCSAAHVEGVSITIEEVCARITDALCAGRAACCTAPTVAQQLTDEECRSRVALTCETRSQPHADRDPYLPLDMAFDQRKAAQLVARFEDASAACGLAPYVSTVRTLRSPHLREGDRCSDDRECPEELACIPDSTETPEARRCKPPAQAAGAPCLVSGHCSQDFGCRGLEGVAVGTCDTADLDEPCDHLPCRAGLICKKDFSASTTACVVPGTVGAPCTKLLSLFTGCAEGFYCRGDSSDAGFCAERLADAETCDDRDACRSNLCMNSDGSRRCAACTDETCSWTCVGGACVAPPPPPRPHQPRWPTSVDDPRTESNWCDIGAFIKLVYW